MDKPRETTIAWFVKGKLEKVRVIEKSAADKLAEACDKAGWVKAKHFSAHDDAWHILDGIEKALKNYRGTE